MSDMSIPMQVSGGKLVAQPSALEMVTGLAGAASKLNEVRLQNAQFAAKQKAGKIIASAPTLEDGVALLQTDPDTAAFAPEFIQNVMTTKNSILEAAGKEQTQMGEAFGKFLQFLPAAVNDPAQLPAIKASALELASPILRPRLEKSFGYVEEALNTAGTPEKKLQLIAGWATAGGVGDALKNVLGTPTQMNLGNRVVAGVTAPAQGGPGGQAPGSFSTGNALTPGIPPQLAGAQNVPFPGSGPGSNPLAITPPAPPPAAAPAAAPTPPGPAPADAPRMSALGVPLFDPRVDLADAPTAAARDIAGNPAGVEGERVREMMKSFTTEGKDKYEGSVNLKGQLAQINHDLDVMAANGGWLVPGSAADLRLALGKLKSTVQTATGSAPDIDTSKVAAAENFNKVVQQMAGSLLNNMYGQQREAAETIRNITDKGVPGINNSLMGGKMISVMFNAVADRSIDRYEWDTAWANARNGDLRGADVAFNKKFPAKLYIDKALESIGMTETGFKTVAALKAARDSGLFTEEQYRAILKNEGKIPADLPKVKAN